jgi:hypothetical protein
MTFTIDAENNISAFATAEEAAASTTNTFESFTSQKELFAIRQRMARGTLGRDLEQSAGSNAGGNVQDGQSWSEQDLGKHSGLGQGRRTGRKAESG